MNELRLLDEDRDDFLFSVPIDERYISSQEKDNLNNSNNLNCSFNDSNIDFFEKFMISDNKSKDNSYYILNDLKLNKSYSAIVNLNNKYNSNLKVNSSIKKQSSEVNQDIAYNLMNKTFKEISSFEILESKVVEDKSPYLNSSSFNYLNDDSFKKNIDNENMFIDENFKVEGSGENTKSKMIRDMVISENIEEVRSGVLNKLLMMDLIYTPLNNRSPINMNFKQFFSINDKIGINNTKVILRNISNKEIEEKINRDRHNLNANTNKIKDPKILLDKSNKKGDVINKSKQINLNSTNSNNSFKLNKIEKDKASRKKNETIQSKKP